MPRALSMTISLVLVALVLFLIVEMVTMTITEMAEKMSIYQTNVENMIQVIKNYFGLSKFPAIEDLLSKADLETLATVALSAVSGTASNAVIVALYIGFLLMEQGSFSKKLVIIYQKNKEEEEKVNRILINISREIRTYMLIKTIDALLCAIIALVVMLWLGLDFAIFWSFLTFLTYYIPTFGPALAIALPTLFSLVQFDSLTPALFILVISGGLQTAVANLIEPRFLGRSMNLSPFVMIVSLFLWGSLWGLTGMFLCVPIIVIAMIILANFPSTWPIAVFLASEGSVPPPKT